MTTATEVHEWGRSLALEIERQGELADPQWRAAFERVPRHLFIPDRFWLGGEVFTVFDRDADPINWWRNVYDDCFIVMQVDDGRPAEPGAQGDYSTSSTSQPSLVFRMLRELDVAEGQQILEIGTGTGYNAALLSARLEDDSVTTVEVDPRLAERARAYLDAAGWQPTVITADGAGGYPPNTLYDRVIATCSVQRIPYAWVEQTRPGGRILTPWGTPYHNGVLVRLTASRDGTATGPIIGESAFMWLRGQRAPFGRLRDFLQHEDQAERTSTNVDPHAVLGDADAEFAIGLWVPGCQAQVCHADDDSGEFTIWFFDGAGSWASIDYEPDVLRYTVEQYGPRRLWKEIEYAYQRWTSLGEPERERFGVTVTPSKQRIWLDEPDNPVA